MFPFSSRGKSSDAPEPTPAPSKAVAVHPLDALTGGAFSAATSGDRAAKVREWLVSNPSPEQLQEVFKELSARDKGAAKAIRERMEELRRAKGQEALAVEWADKAEKLLQAGKLNIADALAWQRDAAKAGAPLSKEPLSAIKLKLAERVKVIEDLQHRVQVQREAAVLLAQRVEVLSTKSWTDAQAAQSALTADVAHWQEQASELEGDTNWGSVEARFPTLLDGSKAQLLVVWEAFQSALAQTAAAAENAQAPLPSVPVWADEIRAARGLPTEAEQAAARAAAAKPALDPQEAKRAQAAVSEALAKLKAQTAEGHGKAASGAAAELRAALKVHGKLIDNALEHEVNTALIAAGELEGWQRWSADKVREELIAKAEGLLKRPEGQALGGRKLQESLRQLREEWKKTDQSGPTNHGLWKRFDEACNAVHKQVGVWLEKVREEGAKHRAERETLIAELKAWGAEHTASADWKQILRGLHQFGDRWRASGHVGEKAFGELQQAWKQAMAEVSAPLETAQKTSILRREALIAEAAKLAEAPHLNIDAVRELQRQWQVEAQSVPMDRRQEQKLWDAFRKPLDQAFERKTQQRQRVAEQLSARDQGVVEASKALEKATAGGDAQQIQAAMQALQEALKAQQQQAESVADIAAVPAAEAQASEGQSSEVAAAEAEPAAKPVAAPRPVVAVRGDDRPGAKREVPSTTRPERRDGGKPARPARPGDREAWGGRDRRDDRYADRREDRGPRLGDTAFRAQRDAMEHAQSALRKLASQAHGQALTQLIEAWAHRDAAQLPTAQDLGGRLPGPVRASWGQAIQAAPKGDAAEALLRLEMAADVPTPADQINARRALQLQLLTQRNAPSPQETWAQDVARVLAAPCDEGASRRLQAVLKPLLRK